MALKKMKIQLELCGSANTTSDYLLPRRDSFSKSIFPSKILLFAEMNIHSPNKPILSTRNQNTKVKNGYSINCICCN